MNARIQQLAAEAFRWSHFMANNDDPDYADRSQSSLYNEKFAELILFECVKIAVFKGDAATGRAIKEHFGVEE